MVESESNATSFSSITHGIIRLHTISFSTTSPPLSETNSSSKLRPETNETQQLDTIQPPVTSARSKPNPRTTENVIQSHSSSIKAKAFCYLLPFAIGEKYGKFRALLEQTWINDILLYWILVDYENGPYFLPSNNTIFVSMTQKETYRTVKEKVANAFIYITENMDLFRDCLYFLKVDYDMYVNTRLVNFTFSRWPSTQTYFGQLNPKFRNTFERMQAKHKRPNQLDWWATPMWTTFGFTRDFMPKVAKMFVNHTTDHYPKWVVWDDQMAGYYMMKNGIPGYPLGLYKATNALHPKWKLPKNFNRTNESCKAYALKIFDPCISYYHALKWHRRCLFSHLHILFEKEEDSVYKQCLRRPASDFTYIFPNLLKLKPNGTLSDFLGLLPE